MNVLDLRGPDFLLFYIVLLAGMTILAAIARWILRGPADVPPHAGGVDPYEAAYLAGGPRMAVNAAITSLAHAGRITVRAGGSIKPTDAPAFELGFASTLEQKVFEAVATGKSTVNRLRSEAGAYTAPIAERLRADELTPTLAQSVKIRLASAALMLPALLIGVAKLGVGLARNRPVGFLLFLCIGTAVLMLVFLFRPVYGTRAGSRVLARLRSRNSALATAAKTAPDRLANSDIALALALFGPTVLATGDLLGLRQVLWPPGSSGSSGCGSGSSGGGGGGGGGCGGGCGGCGG